MSSVPIEGRTMTVWFGKVTSGVISLKRPGRTAEPPIDGRRSSHPKVTFWPGIRIQKVVNGTGEVRREPTGVDFRGLTNSNARRARDDKADHLR